MSPLTRSDKDNFFLVEITLFSKFVIFISKGVKVGFNIQGDLTPKKIIINNMEPVIFFQILFYTVAIMYYLKNIFADREEE